MPPEACRLESETGPASLEAVPGDYLAFYENIAGVLLRGEPLAVTAESARDALAVIEAAAESAASGQVVKVRGLA